MLDEVVVVGYGTVKKKDLTGSLSSVTTDQLLETNRTNIGGALQRQVAGVDAVRANNKPGAGFNFMIRGQNTIKAQNGSDDEQTDINNINPPLYVVDGMFVSSIDDIAPDDIDRIDILKDASSTAIYGSRGANGVVLITTKRGGEGKSYVEYSGTVSFGKAMNQPQMLNAEEYAQYRIDRAKGNNYTDPNYTPDLPTLLGSQYYNNYINGKDLNWRDEVLETSVSHSHNARIYGSGTGLTYTFGVGYTKDDGIIGKDGYERYNFSTSINKKLNDYFKAGMNMYSAYSVKQGAGTETFRTLYRLTPLTDMYEEDGSLRLYPDENYTGLTNPLLEQDNVITQDKTIHVFGNLFLEYAPASWIKFTTTFIPDVSYWRGAEYRAKDSKSANGNQGSTRAIYDTNNHLKYTWDNVLYGEQQFGDHGFNLTLGTSFYKSMYENAHIRTDGVTNDKYLWYNLAAGTDIKELTSGYTQEQLMSYFGRFNYDYKGRYLFTLTGRWDGSSKLAAGHKWKFFPSAAAAWRITEENFMRNVNTLDNLKLRLSYGVSGNNGVGAYSSAQTVGNSKYIFGNENVYNSAWITGFENNTLTWETTAEVNLGLDFSLFNYRLNGTVDLYNRRTSNIIMDRVMSIMTGYDNVTDNVGKVDNRGIELSLNTVNIKTKDFTWSTTLNFTTNQNKIVSLNDGSTEDKSNGWFVGKSIGAVYTYKFLGFWQQDEAEEAAKYGLMPGSIKVEDKDQNYVLDNEDKEVVGSIFPTWTGGITNNFTYKNFDLSFFIQTRQGQYSYSQFHRSHSMGDREEFNVIKLNYWTPENPTGTWYHPGVAVGEWGAVGYMKTSYTKVGYITVGYTLPKPALEKIGLTKLRIYASCNNPFIFTNYEGWDPETASENSYTQYPMVRSFLLGLNMTF